VNAARSDDEVGFGTSAVFKMQMDGVGALFEARKRWPRWMERWVRTGESGLEFGAMEGESGAIVGGSGRVLMRIAVFGPSSTCGEETGPDG